MTGWTLLRTALGGASVIACEPSTRPCIADGPYAPVRPFGHVTTAAGAPVPDVAMRAAARALPACAGVVSQMTVVSDRVGRDAVWLGNGGAPFDVCVWL